jgi:hypothetical protein
MNTLQTASEPLPASDLLAPWWAVNVPELEDDHTCTRCGHAVHLEHGSEWLGPNDNYHWNLCNSCDQELVVEMWKKLDAVANIVTTHNETKESFISRVRLVLWANVKAEAPSLSEVDPPAAG